MALFFGNLIKAMISRQREYLADASAVQFTRNPFGIGGALKKIGGSVYGTQIRSQQAEEYSHLYFMDGIDAPVFDMMSTHPPLAERIRRVEPNWDGRYIKTKRKPAAEPKEQKSQPSKAKAVINEPMSMITTAAVMEAIMSTGLPTANHVNYAKKLISEIPAPLLAATREPLGAYALVLGLLMQRQLLANITEQDKVLNNVDREVRQQLRSLLGPLMTLDIKYRLPLIELAILPLKSLSAKQLEAFNQQVLAIINFDGYVEVWEWALHYWISSLSLNTPAIPKAIYGDFSNLTLESSVLLSAVAHASRAGVKASKRAYADAEIELGIPLKIINKDALSSDLLIQAVGEMRNLKPLVKPKFLKSLCLMAQYDGVVEAKEIELIRTISEGMGCPMPPILDNEYAPY